VINCVACAGPETKMPAASQPSHAFFISRLLDASL
jgi:hypothetical protein